MFELVKYWALLFFLLDRSLYFKININGKKSRDIQYPSLTVPFLPPNSGKTDGAQIKRSIFFQHTKAWILFNDPKFVNSAQTHICLLITMTHITPPHLIRLFFRLSLGWSASSTGSSGTAGSTPTGRTSSSTSSLGHGRPHGEFGWGCAVSTSLTGSIAHNATVNRARHAIVLFGVQLGQHVRSVDWGVRDVPHGRGLHNVLDDELADGLVLGTGLGAVDAPHELDVSATVLVASVIATFTRHLAATFSPKKLERTRLQGW